MMDVQLDRVFGQAQLGGHDLVLLALGDQGQHLPFAAGQVADGRVGRPVPGRRHGPGRQKRAQDRLRHEDLAAQQQPHHRQKHVDPHVERQQAQPRRVVIVQTLSQQFVIRRVAAIGQDQHVRARRLRRGQHVGLGLDIGLIDDQQRHVAALGLQAADIREVLGPREQDAVEFSTKRSEEIVWETEFASQHRNDEFFGLGRGGG